MSRSDLPQCPICHSSKDLLRQTSQRGDQTFLWYVCGECDSALLWLGGDRWVYQRVGRGDRTHLLNRPVTSDELQRMALESDRLEPISLDATQRAAAVCPYCAETIQAAAIVCKHCHRTLPGHEREVASLASAGHISDRSRAKRFRTLPVLLGLLVVAGVAIVLAILLARQGGEDTVSVAVPAQEGGVVGLQDGASIVFPPGALTENSQITIKTLTDSEASSLLGDRPALGSVYEVTAEGGSVFQQINLQLPYDDRGLSSADEENLSVYYEEGGRFVGLPSWVDVDANVVHARTTHLTPFWVQINPFDNPEFVRVWSDPTKLAFSALDDQPLEDLTVFAEVDDDNLDSVKMRWSFVANASSFTCEAYDFAEMAEALHTAAMIVDLDGMSPPVQTDFVPENQKGSGGCYVSMTSDWISAEGGSDDVYGLRMNLGDFGWDEWDLVAEGLTQIKVDLIAEDADGQPKEDYILIDVIHSRIASDIRDATPGDGDIIFTPRPGFNWTMESIDYEAGRFYLAKGNVLWEDQGRPRYVIDGRSVALNTGRMALEASDSDLEPGQYCWGLEISNDNDLFGETDDIFTAPYCFEVHPGPPLEVAIRPGRGTAGEDFHVEITGPEWDGTFWYNAVELIGPSGTGYVQRFYEVMDSIEDGSVVFTIGTDGDMAPGIYTVAVIANDGAARAEQTFELLAPEPSPVPIETDTPVPVEPPPPTASPTPEPLPTRTPAPATPTRQPARWILMDEFDLGEDTSSHQWGYSGIGHEMTGYSCAGNIGWRNRGGSFWLTMKVEPGQDYKLVWTTDETGTEGGHKMVFDVFADGNRIQSYGADSQFAGCTDYEIVVADPGAYTNDGEIVIRFEDTDDGPHPDIVDFVGTYLKIYSISN